MPVAGRHRRLYSTTPPESFPSDRMTYQLGDIVQLSWPHVRPDNAHNLPYYAPNPWTPESRHRLVVVEIVRTQDQESITTIPIVTSKPLASAAEIEVPQTYVCLRVAEDASPSWKSKSATSSSRVSYCSNVSQRQTTHSGGPSQEYYIDTSIRTTFRTSDCRIQRVARLREASIRQLRSHLEGEHTRTSQLRTESCEWHVASEPKRGLPGALHEATTARPRSSSEVLIDEAERPEVQICTGLRKRPTFGKGKLGKLLGEPSMPGGAESDLRML